MAQIITAKHRDF